MEAGKQKEETKREEDQEHAPRMAKFHRNHKLGGGKHTHTHMHTLLCLEALRKN